MKKSQLWDPYADFQKTVLPNGLAVYSTYWDRSWVHARFCVNTGSANDSRGKSGLAHFVEHMLNSDLEKNKEIIKNLGGRARFGDTDLHCTDFHFVMPLKKKSIVKALDIFGKMLNEAPSDKCLEKERAIILQEFYRKYPSSIAHELRHLAFRNTYRGTLLEGFLGTLGIPETINSISIEDIRNFFIKNYAPANMSIIVAGGMNHDAVIKFIMGSDFFSKSSNGSRRFAENVLQIEPPHNNEELKIISEIFPGFLSDVSSISSCSIIPGYFSNSVIRIFAAILGDMLTHEIREKHHSTYDVDVAYVFIGGCYEFTINTVFNPADLKLVKEIIFSKLSKATISERVFEKKKQEIIHSYFLSDITIKQLCENVQSDLVKYGRIISMVEEMDKLAKTSFEEYKLLSDYLADTRRWWSLIQIP